jgi:hypothetical protein
MTELRVSEAVGQAFPRLRIAVVIARGVRRDMGRAASGLG